MAKTAGESPRTVSLLALEALDRYIRSGLVHPGEELHLRMATRLAKVARSGKWVR